MVDTLPMSAENPSEDARINRTMLTVFIVALLLVATMVAVIFTWNNIQGESADFKDDCRDLGGTPHDLGNETVCLVEGHVVGRQG